MKIHILLLLFILLSAPIAFAQPTPPKTISLKTDKAQGLEVIKVIHPLTTMYYLLLNATDSILFRTIDHGLNDAPPILESMWIETPIQLDQKGSEEIILKHVRETSNEHVKRHFIINRDTKKVIFEGNYVHVSIHTTPQERWEYTSKMTFNEQKELVVDYGMHSTTHSKSSVKEGIYALQNGVFCWQRPLVAFTRNILATNDTLGVKIIQQGNCEKNLINYFLFYNNDQDSLLFLTHYGCLPYSSTINQITFRSCPADEHGNSMLLLEFNEPSYNMEQTRSVIFQLDAHQIVFSEATKAIGTHHYGEEIGPPFHWQFTVSFGVLGELIVEKIVSTETLNDLKEGTYRLIDGKYRIQSEE